MRMHAHTQIQPIFFSKIREINIFSINIATVVKVDKFNFNTSAKNNCRISDTKQKKSHKTQAFLSNCTTLLMLQILGYIMCEFPAAK